MWSVLQADARRIPLKDGSVHCVVTSPPYWGLRDYGVAPSIWGGGLDCIHEWGENIEVNATHHTDKRRWNHTRNGRGEEQPIEKRVAWRLRTPVTQGQLCHLCGAWFGCLGLEPTPELFVLHIVEVFREVWRVLRDDGTIWLNLGDSYANDSKWGGSTGGKHVKALHDTNVGRGRRHTGLKAKDLVGLPWRVAFALQADDWYLRSDIIWSKPNPMPESVTDRPTKAHEYIFLLSKRPRYYFDQNAAREPYSLSGIERSEYGYNHAYRNQFAGSPTDDRFQDGKKLAASHKGSKFHTGKTGVNAAGRASELPREDNPAGRNIRSVWTIATQPFKGAHFATFPQELALRCIKVGSKPGDVVFDPFGGAGTVSLVADKLGRIGISAELNREYCEMAYRRCFDDSPLLSSPSGLGVIQ